MAEHLDTNDFGIIELYGEDDECVRCEVLDAIQMNGKLYLVLTGDIEADIDDSVEMDVDDDGDLDIMEDSDEVEAEVDNLSHNDGNVEAEDDSCGCGDPECDHEFTFKEQQFIIIAELIPDDDNENEGTIQIIEDEDEQQAVFSEFMQYKQLDEDEA